MSIKLPTKKWSQTNQPEVGFVKTNQPQVGFKRLTKKVSYNHREDYIYEIETQLMDRFKCGYSALHKKLILKEANNQFSGAFL